MIKILILHTAKTTKAIRPRSPRDRANIVRDAAQLHGWAYATVRSGPGVRTVVESSVPGLPVGATHLDLDVYQALEEEVR